MPSHPSAERFNIFVDEFGNEDFSEFGPASYGIAFTFHDNSLSIQAPLDTLNLKLTEAGYTGMIHLADLIAQRDVYADLDLDTRRAIFRAIYHFAMHTPICINSITVDMNMLNSPEQLTMALRQKTLEYFERIRPILEKYRQVVVYYDKGQPIPTKIFNELLSLFPNMEIRPNFDHTEKRLFQVSDMVTKLDKMQFDIDHGRPWTKGEHYFITKKDFREVRRQLNRKLLR